MLNILTHTCWDVQSFALKIWRRIVKDSASHEILTLKDAFDFSQSFVSFLWLDLRRVIRETVFFSFSTSFNRLRVCKIESSESSSMFFHKEFWSFSTIVILWMSNRVSRIVWWTSCAILYKKVNICVTFSTHRIYI
jgi:hypothetical protein